LARQAAVRIPGEETGNSPHCRERKQALALAEASSAKDQRRKE
jgi:hypothetical protein